jgi:hypothetical protein
MMWKIPPPGLTIATSIHRDARISFSILGSE